MKLRTYAACLGAVSVAAVACSLAFLGAPNPWHFGVFLVLQVFADRLEVEAPVRGIAGAGLPQRAPGLSPGFLVVLTAAFTTDLSTVLLVGFASQLVPGAWRGSVVRATINAAQVSLYGAGAAAAFSLVGSAVGTPLVALLLAATAGALVGELLNMTFVAGAISLERSRSVLRVLAEMVWAAPHSLAAGGIALLVAVLYAEVGSLAGVFVLVPLFVLRRARYGKLEVDDARERTLRAFIRAVELKDPYTSRHSERVAAITVELHRVLGTDEDELEQRYYGALLHDIGKVAVSGRILTKPGRLSEDELDAVRRHPSVGAVVVQNVEFLRGLLADVLYHHERLDGKGYPAGLTGDEIPFAARVLAVADTFEALTSDRPYRPALANDEALAEIQRVAGTQLDEAPVAALGELFGRGQVTPARFSPVPVIEEKGGQGLVVGA